MHDKNQRAAAVAAPLMHFDRIGCCNHDAGTGRVQIELQSDRVWTENGEVQRASLANLMLATDLNGAIDLYNTLGRMISAATRPATGGQN